MTVDPTMEGRRIEPDEAEAYRLQQCADWYADLLVGLGREDLADDVRRPALNPAPFESGQIQINGARGYGALVIDGIGLFPIAGTQSMDRFQMLKAFASDYKRQAAILVLSAEAVVSARMRSTDAAAVVESDAELTSKLSSTIILDGVALSWDTDAVEPVSF